jgi:fatty acid desaturase
MPLSRSGSSSRHRQIDRWDRVIRRVCAASMVIIMIVAIVTAGWWAWFLMLLALAVGLIGISASDAS